MTKDERREYLRAWRAKRPGYSAAKMRAKRASDPDYREHELAYQRKYYIEHHDESRARSKAWFAAHPGYQATWRRNRKSLMLGAVP